MPYLKANDISIYYEVRGDGEPLLLLMGLGGGSSMWWQQMALFSRRYRVVLFDSRGVGRTDQPDTVYTMDMLKLTRVNHCVVLPQNETTKGMLQACKDYVTWGEVGHETIAKLLHQRGEITGGSRLTDAYVKDNSKYTSILSLAKAIEKGEAKVLDVKGLKPVLRLPPPRKGYESTRRTYTDRGALGYRGADIEKLLDRMLAKPKEAK